ncbi:leucine--tRNA ligase, mitochondrial-like isoform X2 [Ornithodoros turicata]|uniref:leucine--tRNA ligase, mitochondrial-like isoform X2 n=1 Tax=Ornithodoros turicata TaxID=34597 RepID=UPI003139500A
MSCTAMRLLTGIPNLQHGRQHFRTIFSVSSIWDPKLSLEQKVEIEHHWKDKINHTVRHIPDSRSKMYILSMFPYPSGQLHLGHVRVYTISDTFARYYQLQGKEVIHPMGWDSFGLPAENAAVERNENPCTWTENNIAAMKKQLQDMNFNFDWSREVSTCSPEYYRWTQYLFLMLYHKGLAYRKNSIVNWDPIDRTVLADEQVDADGHSWRSGAKIEKKVLKQWFIKTTYFSKALYDGLNDPLLQGWDDVVNMQRGWIGECTGYAFSWTLFVDGQQLEDPLAVWTEHPELLYGVSFVAVSKDHILAHPALSHCGDSELTNIVAENPISGKRVPVFITDSFAYPHATQSYLGIPCFSKDDADFAQLHGLELNNVLSRNNSYLINSGDLTGLSMEAARQEVCKRAHEKGCGGYITSNKLRDWLISRQRYWGTPIPIVHCPSCKLVPVPYEELAVKLPQLSKATKDGVSPLCGVADWLHTTCPQCGGPATRETDTMDTFVDSSWYYLRFLDPKNQRQLQDPSVAHLMPVDLYIGGLEHAVLHLYYARFMSHFCHMCGLTKSPEPFHQMLVHGMVLNETYRLQDTGQYLPKSQVEKKGSKTFEKDTGKPVVVEWDKMSKSKHNGIRPEDVVGKYGIDATRLFILSAYAPTSRYKWPSPAFRGIISWQERLWLTIHDFRKSKESSEGSPNDAVEAYYYEGRNHFLKHVNHKYNVTRQLNLIIKDLQTYTKYLRHNNRGTTNFGCEFERALAALIIMLAPIAPHFASELWAGFSNAAEFTDVGHDITKPVMQQAWPQVDMDYNLDLLVKEGDEDLMKLMVPRYQLDTLTKEEAYQMVIKSDSLRTRLQKWPRFQVAFELHPSYMATLRFIPQKDITSS